METLLLFAAGVSLAGCLYASVLVLKSPLYGRKQKLVQLVIIWVVPLIGGWLIAYFARGAGPLKPAEPSTAGDGGYTPAGDVELTSTGRRTAFSDGSADPNPGGSDSAGDGD